MGRMILLVLIGALLVGPAQGQSSLNGSSQGQSARRADAQDIARTQARYRDAVIRARRLEQEVEALDRRIAATQSRLASLPQEGDPTALDQRNRLDAVGQREARALETLALARGPLSRVLGALQSLTRHPPPPLITPPDQATRTVRAALVMQALIPPLEARVARADQQRDTVVAERRALALTSERLFVSESQSGDQRATMDSRLSADRTRRAGLGAEARRARQEAEALRKRLVALGAPVPDVPVNQTPSLRLPAGRDSLMTPVEGRPDLRFGNGSTGWQWSAAGQGVAAPLDAGVLHAGPLENWGQVIILDAGPGWHIVLSGLVDLEVATGDRVRTGQRLGLGASDQPVRFELRREDVPVDPSPWFD